MGSFWQQGPQAAAPTGQLQTGQTPFYLTPGQQSAFNDYKAQNGPTSALTGRPNDFNLGGFAPAPPGAPNDPPVTTQPQPYQQGPGGTISPILGPNSPINDPSPWGQKFPGMEAPRTGGVEHMPEVWSDPVYNAWYDQQRAAGRTFEDISRQGMAQDGVPGYSWSGTAGPVPHGPRPGMPDMGGSAQPGPYGAFPMNGDPNSMQHLMGRAGGGGAATGQVGGAFGGGIAIGPNGGFINPGDGSPYQGGMSAMGPQQPMNPGQQSGQVQMQAPDGTMQYVNQEHVPHYQGLGAQVVNGSSYGSGQ